MKPHRFHAAALAELDQAAAGYEQQHPGLGAELIAAVERAIGLIAETPATFPLVPKTPAELGLRRFVLRRFPFVIIYADEPAELIVVAVAHTRRKPGYWRSRL